MPVDPTRVCACHGEPSYISEARRWCAVKRRERAARYNVSQKARESQRRYRERFPARVAAHRGRRLWLANQYQGRVTTVDEATAINAHIRSRLDVFKQGFKGRAEMEAHTPGGVSSSTISRES